MTDETNKELEKRVNVISHIIEALPPKITIGMTGSTANGDIHNSSDLDLFLIISPENLEKNIDCIYKLKTFQIPSVKVISGFKDGQIDVIFLYGEIEEIPINIEIYSLNFVKKLLNLENLEITRFRTRPTAQSLTFSNAYGESIRVEMKIKRFAEGNLSLLPGSIKKDNIIYIGNHLRKLLFGKIYKDENEIKNLIYNCFSYFVEESIKNNNFSDKCLINLSIFDLTKKLNKDAQNFYQKLCMDILSSKLKEK